MQRIGRHFLQGRNHHQVHVFHWNRAQQHFVAQHDCAHVTFTILKLDPNRAHVRTKRSSSVCRGDFFLRSRFELKLQRHFLRNAQKQRSDVRERFNLQRLLVGSRGVLESYSGFRDAHASKLSRKGRFRKHSSRERVAPV